MHTFLIILACLVGFIVLMGFILWLNLKKFGTRLAVFGLKKAFAELKKAASAEHLSPELVAKFEALESEVNALPVAGIFSASGILKQCAFFVLKLAEMVQEVVLQEGIKGVQKLAEADYVTAELRAKVAALDVEVKALPAITAATAMEVIKKGAALCTKLADLAAEIKKSNPANPGPALGEEQFAGWLEGEKAKAAGGIIVDVEATVMDAKPALQIADGTGTGTESGAAPAAPTPEAVTADQACLHSSFPQAVIMPELPEDALVEFRAAWINPASGIVDAWLDKNGDDTFLVYYLTEAEKNTPAVPKAYKGLTTVISLFPRERKQPEA